MNIEREELIRQLSTVSGGLSKKEYTEQSDCYVFGGGKIRTFNDLVACSRDTDLPIEGAVQAVPLIALLRKFKAAELDVSQGEGEIQIKAKRKSAGIRTQLQVQMPMIEEPSEWADLPDGFQRAAGLITRCTEPVDGTVLSSVHVNPDFIESCDRNQFARWYAATGVLEPVLIEGNAMDLVAGQVDRISVGENWVHFRSDEVVTSCHRVLGDYPDLNDLVEVDGEEVIFPKDVLSAIKAAEVFNQDQIGNERVTVELKPNKARVTGEGSLGWYKERVKVEYAGPSIRFMVSSTVLTNLIQQSSRCEVTRDRLKIAEDQLVYVSCLEEVDE